MSKKLLNARCRVLVKDPWYGTIISRFRWCKFESVETIGVRVVSQGVVECCYNENFVESLEVNELRAVLCHEVEHIIRMHCSRSKFVKSPEAKELYNIAADWVINGHKNNKAIENLPDFGCFIPDQNDKEWKGCDFSNFPDNGTTEEYFDWLKDNTKCTKINGGGDGSGGSGGSGGSSIVVTNKGGKVLSVIDNHEIWDTSSASEEEIRKTAKELARSATARTAGKIPGNLEESIKALEKPKINWAFKCRNIIGRECGNKRKTFSRWNRRRDQFGIKGVSRHASVRLTVGTDTSGSMSTKILEKVFTEIESMSEYFKIMLLQFDTEITSAGRYHKGDWRKIKVKGRGGTCLDSYFDYIENNGLVGKMNIIITDGFDVLPRKRSYPVIWLIIGKKGLEYLESQGKLWGDIVLIEHDYEY